MHQHGIAATAGRRTHPAVGAGLRGPVVAMLGALVALTWAVAQPHGPALRAIDLMHVWAMNPVYSVADVDRALTQNARAWSGRTVLVQGRVAVDRTWCPPDSIVTRLALVDAGRAGGAWPLDLQWSHPDPLLAALRRLPLLGSLVPPPQRPQVGRLGIYRVRLDGLSKGPFPSADLVLLDADPTGR